VGFDQLTTPQPNQESSGLQSVATVELEGLYSKSAFDFATFFEFWDRATHIYLLHWFDCFCPNFDEPVL
jgi:hypothetical protein